MGAMRKCKRPLFNPQKRHLSVKVRVFIEFVKELVANLKAQQMLA